MSTLHEDQYTVLTITRSVPFRMKNVPDQSCTENQNTHFKFNNFFLIENRAVYEINVEKYGRAGQATDDNTAHALCMLDT